MSSRSNKKCWSYSEAQRTTLYVRYLLGSLRECFIAAWHHHRRFRHDPTDSDSHDLAAIHRREGVTLLGELDRLGILAYQNPLRGIALFPFAVAVRDAGQSARREAFWVYRDSRFECDRYILNDDLCTHCDLEGHERPIPAAWMEPGAVPTLNGETKP
jgi:hypothetical protein